MYGWCFVPNGTEAQNWSVFDRCLSPMRGRPATADVMHGQTVLRNGTGFLLVISEIITLSVKSTNNIYHLLRLKKFFLKIILEGKLPHF
jgi:hypothetical protein